MNKKACKPAIVFIFVLLSLRLLVVGYKIYKNPVVNADGLSNAMVDDLVKSAMNQHHTDVAQFEKKPVSFLELYLGLYEVSNEIVVSKKNVNGLILYEVYININCDSSFNELFSYTYLLDGRSNIISATINKKSL